MHTANNITLETFAGMLREKRYSERSIELFNYALRSLIKYAAPRPLRELQVEDLANYLNAVYDKYAPGTQHVHARAVALYCEVLGNGPASDLPHPTSAADAKPLVILSKEEVGKLISSTHNVKHKAMLGLAYDTGLKLGEMLSLTRLDLRTKDRRLIIGPKASRRTLTISDPLNKILEAYQAEYKPTAYYFEGKTEGQPLTDRGAQEIIKRAARRAGITAPITFHTLRHTCAVHLLEYGADTKLLRRQLGHESSNMLNVYQGYARGGGGIGISLLGGV